MLYQSGEVSVDEQFARFGSKSFAINKINSMDVRKSTKKGGKGYIVLWVIAVGGLIAAFDSSTRGVGLGVAAVCGFLGYNDWTTRHDVHTFKLFLVTSSTEAQAFESNSLLEIERLRHAIEKAMTLSN